MHVIARIYNNYISRGDKIGIQTKRTETKTKEKEKLLSSGVMGESTPRALQNTAFFVVVKMFSLVMVLNTEASRYHN